MEISPLIIIIVIAIFSVVQSMFGVGLLVFGTPTFILLGADYAESVGYLIPSSILLSLLQTHGFRNNIRIARGIIKYSLPFVLIGMIFAVTSNHNSNVTIGVGVIMLFSAILRFTGIDKIKKVIRRFSAISLIVTGFIHGISNQGGALLTIVMSSIYYDKEKVRTNIALAYLMFGLVQLLVLLLFDLGSVGYMSIVYSITTFILYHLVGKFLFSIVDINMFNTLFSLFMAIYGVLLLAQVFIV